MDFSVIIPAKNEERNIANCLDSISAIDYPGEHYEVIVVDNGSTDRTVIVAEEKGAKVYAQPGLTISGLRNFGARQAVGKILCFLDADCTVSEDWLKEASRYLDSTKIACFGSAPVVPSNATWVQKTWFRVRKKRSLIEEVAWLESMNMFIPAAKFISVSGFDESLVTCEDYELSSRLLMHGKIISDQGIVAVHHGEAADLCHFFRKERWRATSNRGRLLENNFHLSELPSLLLPPVYCLLALTTLLCLLLFGLVDHDKMNCISVLLVLIWQFPLFGLVLWKLRPEINFMTAMQLHLLLNVYFCARGLAMFQPCNRSAG